MDRILTICGEITDEEMNPIINSIYEISDYGGADPIKLIINTNGGNAYCANAVVAAIEMSKVPVHTFGIGRVMSGGIFVLAAGKKRYAHHLTSFMYHGIDDIAEGNAHTRRIQSMETDRLQLSMDKFITSKTSMTQDMIDEESQNDWHFGATTALELGIIDEIS